MLLEYLSHFSSHFSIISAELVKSQRPTSSRIQSWSTPGSPADHFHRCRVAERLRPTLIPEMLRGWRIQLLNCSRIESKLKNLKPFRDHQNHPKTCQLWDWKTSYHNESRNAANAQTNHGHAGPGGRCAQQQQYTPATPATKPQSHSWFDQTR